MVWEGLAKLLTPLLCSGPGVIDVFGERDPARGGCGHGEVRAARGSYVCVAVVDKSVYLLRSGFRLTPAQVSGAIGTGVQDLHRGLSLFNK